MPYARGADLSASPASRKTQDDLADLIARATRLAAPVLAARGQTVALGPAVHHATIAGRSSRLCALLACAIQEVSGCTVRGGAIACVQTRHAVALQGENPIIMPEQALSLDWLMQVRAKALGVRAMLEWEQGRGPVLTLILPAAQEASGRGAPFAVGCQPA